MWTQVFESSWWVRSDKFDLNKITVHGRVKKLEEGLTNFEAYANQLVQANEKEAHGNNQYPLIQWSSTLSDHVHQSVVSTPRFQASISSCVILCVEIEDKEGQFRHKDIMKNKIGELKGIKILNKHTSRGIKLMNLCI